MFDRLFGRGRAPAAPAPPVVRNITVGRSLRVDPLAWRRFGGEALLPWTISLALVVIPAATAEFDYRYVLVAVPFACLAAAMAFSPGTAGGDLARRLRAGLGKRRQRPAGAGHAGAERAGADRVRAAADVTAGDKAAAPAGGSGHDQRDLASDGT